MYTKIVQYAIEWNLMTIILILYRRWICGLELENE